MNGDCDDTSAVSGRGRANKTHTRTRANVPSKVRNCTAPPDHVRSEISFSCTSYFPNWKKKIINIFLAEAERF